jgi:flagellar capping protein FliD
VSLPGPGSNSGKPTGPTVSVSATVQNLISQANQEYQQGLTDLKNGNFSAYGTDSTALQSTLQQLQQAAGTSSTSTTTPSKATSKSTSKSTKASSTTTTVPASVALGAGRG